MQGIAQEAYGGGGEGLGGEPPAWPHPLEELLLSSELNADTQPDCGGPSNALTGGPCKRQHIRITSVRVVDLHFGVGR